MPDSNAHIEAYFVKKDEYELRVRRGTPDDYYSERKRVKIEAHPPPEGQVFGYWNVEEGGADVVEDVNSPKTWVRMPRGRVEVRVIWKEVGEEVLYRLRVESGDGDGRYVVGSEVPIVARESSDGKVFYKWEVFVGDESIVKDMESPETNIIMPSTRVKMRATYIDDDIDESEVQIFTHSPKTYSLEVLKGSGSGNYTLGSEVSIVARESSDGKVFYKWEMFVGDESIVKDMESLETNIIMPSTRVQMRATYKDEDIDESEVQIVTHSPKKTYSLEVLKGSGSGNYASGESVLIFADDAPKRKKFKQWKVIDGDQDVVEDLDSPSTKLLMPEQGLVVRPMYKWKK